MKGPEVVAYRAGYSASKVGFIDETDAETEWTLHTCPPGANGLPGDLSWVDQAAGVHLAWPVGDPVPPGFFDWLRWEALSRVSVPAELGTVWAPGTVDMPFITQSENWLWLPESQLAPITSSVQSADYIPWLATNYVSTVTLNLDEVHWTGTDTTTVCTPAEMEPYDSDVSYYDQESECTITYTGTEDGQTLTVQGFWSGSHICTPGCGSEPTGTLSSAPFSRPVVVHQIQALNTSTGSSG